ncbi:MAG: DNA primase family protein [Acidimicrobiia bacterium]
MARGIRGIPLDHELLDTNAWLLGVLNGVVDLRTGQFRAPDPADLMTVQCPVAWDDNAECPRWMAALKEWFPNDETRAYVHRLVGQALVGLQRDHLFVIHHGIGGNGKGTFVRALQKVLGPYAATPDLALLTETKWGAHDTATSTLFRARLAVASETERRVKLAEASIKNLTGGDRISARRLYENPWAFTPTHSLWLTTNYQPQITGRDAGIWRRIRVVPWVASFTNGATDPELDAKLTDEAPGILRWAVAGVADWLGHGLDEPDEVVKATTDYRKAEDLLGRFADDVGLRFTRDGSIPKTQLTQLFTTWTRDENVDLPVAALRDWLVGEHGCRDGVANGKTQEGKRRQVRIWRGAELAPVTEPKDQETQPGQSQSSDPVTGVTDFPESPIEKGRYRDFTEGASQSSPILCKVCDKPNTDATFQGLRVHARCGPPGTFSDEDDPFALPDDWQELVLEELEAEA